MRPLFYSSIFVLFVLLSGGRKEKFQPQLHAMITAAGIFYAHKGSIAELL